jgi:uncharacterized protein YciI
MIWIVHCTDAPDAGDRRLAHRAEHSANLRSQTHVGVITSGPLLAGDRGSAASGSLFLVEAHHRAQVEQFVATDPFSIHGVWAEVRLNAFMPSLTPASVGTPIGDIVTTAGV